MDKFRIIGGRKLTGQVSASGSKNAALPILFAALTSGEPILLRRVPQLKDIDTTIKLLQGVGASAQWNNGEVSIHTPKLSATEASYDLVRTMRASVLMLGPLLAREGRAKVSLPGGCAIGTRPVDLHLMGFEKMGAQIKIEHGYIHATCPRLKGADIAFSMPSVGATENLMMAAALAEGKTRLINAAREPEIVDLANFLLSMGAKIQGAGESEIEIDGVSRLSGTNYQVMFDRIEAGTLLLAGAISGGSVQVNHMQPNCLRSFLHVLCSTGANVQEGSDWVKVDYTNGMKGADFVTEPYPGFPTDLQAQLMGFLAQVNGMSKISETIFENRFMHVPELQRLGADIQVKGAEAIIHGKEGCYTGATVMATDLRASASLVLAGLAAKGITEVRRIYHLDRGYESMEKKLESLGAEILRLPD